MYTRLTNQIMNTASKQNISDSLNRLYEMQQKASTGKAYANASENPAVAAQGISLRSTQSQMDVYQNTMAATKTWLDTTDQALQTMTDTLGKAQNLVLQALNDTEGVGERKIAATTLVGYIQAMIDIGNAQNQGHYIFSGLKTDTKPFVMMSGSSGSLVDQIQMNMSITADSSGSLIMNGVNVAQPASNPNEIVIDGHTIDVTHPTGSINLSFTLDGQTIIPNPTTGSTINFLGNIITANLSGTPVFTVDGTSISSGSQNITPPGSVSIIYTGGSLITGGSSVVAPISAAEPNSYYVSGVKITVDNTSGSPVYSFDGQTVTTGSQGFEYLNNVTVHNGPAYGIPASGSPFGGLVSGSALLYHDYVAYNGDANTITRNIAPSQTMAISVNGGNAFDKANGMFDTMIKLRDALRADDYLSPHELTANGGAKAYQRAQAISSAQPISGQPTAFDNQSPLLSLVSQAYGQLKQITTDVTEQLSINGTHSQNLQNSVDRADKASLEIKSQLSQNEDVNLAEAISDVNNQQVVYKAVINMSANVSSMLTLFDKI